MTRIRQRGPAAGRERAAGLYIHVPFCASICSYCHFARTAEHDAGLRRRYVRAVVQELELRRRACPSLGSPGRRLATCYLGGGTPSVLEPDLMTELLAGTLGALPRTGDIEVTAEANPESLTTDLARSWRSAGINRVSVGIQSLDDRVLRLLGRSCDAGTARRALQTACREFPRVAADWILGPGMTRGRLLAELTEAVDLGVEHFSLYLLEIHPGTGMQQAVAAGRVVLPPDSEQEALYLAAREHLESFGVHQYEVANFAREGAESRHNRNYWRRMPYLGLGPGAHGFYGKLRYANPGLLQPYLRSLAAGELPAATLDPLDLRARRLERVILALRTVQGVPVAWLPAGFDPGPGRDQGLWRLADGRLQLTGRGFLRIDTIEEFLAGMVERARCG